MGDLGQARRDAEYVLETPDKLLIRLVGVREITTHDLARHVLTLLDQLEKLEAEKK